MLDSDLIIFATPVYLNNVLGRTKNFLDRIAYLTHYLTLSGKIGVTVATTDGTGVDTVSSYLKLIQTHLGINVVASLGVKSHIIYQNRKRLIDLLENVAIECVNSLEEKRYTNKDVEAIFNHIKVIMSNSKVINFEADYLKKSGMINCDTFDKLCNLERIKEEYFR